MAHVRLTPTCSSRPRSPRQMLIRRQTLGPPYRRTKLSGPSSSAQGPCEPASLSAGGIFSPLHQIASGCFSTVRISSLLAAFLLFLHRAQFLLDQRCDSCLKFLAGRCAAAHGLQVTCLRRTDSSGGLLATSFGGLQHFHGPHILNGRPSSPA